VNSVRLSPADSGVPSTGLATSASPGIGSAAAGVIRESALIHAVATSIAAETAAPARAVFRVTRRHLG
jgi:hypothetical protein